MIKKKLGIYFNPISGRGESRILLEELKNRLGNLFNIQTIESLKVYNEEIIKNFFLNLDLLLVLGGDGTIRPLYPILSQFKIPVCLVPTGNESLVAKEFGIKRDLDFIINLLDNYSFINKSYGIVSSKNLFEPFYLMASLGLDSQLVKAVSKSRINYSSNILYASKIFYALFCKKCNGVIDNTLFDGSIIILNSKFYGAGIRFNNHKENFFSLYLHSGNHLQLLFKFLLNYTGLYKSLDYSTLTNEKEFKIDLKFPYPLQLDGDYISEVDNLNIIKGEEVSFLVRI